MSSPFGQQPPLDSGQGFAPDLLVPEDPSALVTTEELPSPSQPGAASTYDTSIEQLVNAAMETSPTDIGKPGAISKPSATVINAVAQDPGAVVPTMTTPPVYIQCPHPHDVLMPVSGYQLWAGNCRYMNAINARKGAFSTGDRSEQARIALEVVHHIQEQRPAGRFLTAIEVPVAANPNANVPANGSIVSTTMWQVMQETDVLLQLGKHLRETKKEKKRRKKHNRRRKKKKRKYEEEVEESLSSISNLGALESLYYVPAYYPTPDNDSLSLEESSSSSESSSEEEPPPPPPPPPKTKKPRAPPKPRPAPKPKPAPKPAPASSKPVNFHYKPKPMKSQQAALKNEGEMTLPKGVTVRPSGKWVRNSLRIGVFLDDGFLLRF